LKQLYRTYDESCEIFKNYKLKYPNLVDIEVIGTTWEKRDILLIKISKDVATSNSKPALFFTGTIHAREWIGHELAIEFTRYVVENINYNEELNSIFESSVIYLVPCANPDGFDYSQKHFSFWRKNRRANADGSFGVDLNRNFPIGFSKSSNPTSNIYGGPSPFSEPETQALRDFVESHPNISIALDYHSQGNVFFPAHDFRHEDTVDTTDMNVLCANMAKEIKKVSSREYGIHQGKPPASLISGSGREFYYSKGIISTVVEVGSRNISDYLDNMSENIKENIPALISALKEVRNYSKENELTRVENFQVVEVTSSSVKLSWSYSISENIYFEIYRSRKDKSYCHAENLVAKTQSLNFVDTNLQSATNYFYYIRAVDKITKLKSSFAPRIELKTLLSKDEFSRIIYPNKNSIGYVCQKSSDSNNRKHFGVNSLFVGVDKRRGVSYGVMEFDLSTIPKNAVITSAKVHLYPMNRVSTTIENYGEWSVGVVDIDSIDDVASYKDISESKIITYIGRPTQANQLTQGIWREWKCSSYECKQIESHLERGRVLFRVDGPSELRIGRDSQIMQWDIGYNRYSNGLEYRPQLDVTFTLKPNSLEIDNKESLTISKDGIESTKLYSGFDSKGRPIYGIIEFDLNNLDSKKLITRAYLKMHSNSKYLKDDIRFHLEMVEISKDRNYDSIESREIIEKIGYDVSGVDLAGNKEQNFIFDTYSLEELTKKALNKESVAFIIRPSSSKRLIKSKGVSWSQDESLKPTLFLEYIQKSEENSLDVSDVKLSIENSKVKLNWKNPISEDFVGVRVIKNAHRPPKNPFDGQKVYGGSDEYTVDVFGATDIDKYYSIFTYDDVPNYSNAITIKFEGAK
jgi:hypothetical protein